MNNKPLDDKVKQLQEETKLDIDLRTPYQTTKMRRALRSDPREVIIHNQSYGYFFEGEMLK